jgi:glycosyltransferase involved in cell wall biosynthesis
MRLVVDLRRAFDSGLGTYVQQVVPGTLQQLGNSPVTGLVLPGTEARHRVYLGDRPIELAVCTAAPLSAGEQLALRRLVPGDAVFWATSLAHALWAQGTLVATVHDVAQLALPGAAGGSSFVKLASKLYFAHLRRRAKLLLFNSHFTAAEFTRLVGASVGRQVVTPLGVDCRHWQPAMSAEPRPRQTPYLLFVGNLRPHKNLPVLLRAFEALRLGQRLDLVLVGQTDGFRTSAGAVLHGLQAQWPGVHHLGPLSDPELRHLMRHAEALVMPSLYEGFGLPALEAMASGCPVIAAQAGALPEVCGDAALYFPPTDVDALRQRIQDVAAWTPEQRRAHCSRALRHAAAHAWGNTVALTAAALRPLLQPQ